MDLAVFGTSDGGLVVGRGPFEARADPPVRGLAFYRNDFSLSRSSPWLIPAAVERLGAGEPVLAGLPPPPRVRWSEPAVDPFAEVFAGGGRGAL